MHNVDEKRELKVLSIEASETCQRLLGALLDGVTAYRTSYVVAGDLASGLALLASEGADVVLLDPELPDCRGFEAIYAVVSGFPELPVLLAVSGEDLRLEIDALQLGVQELLVKDGLSVRSLERSLRSALERKLLAADLHAAKREADRVGWELHEANERLVVEIAQREKLHRELEEAVATLAESNAQLDRANVELQQSQAALQRAAARLEIEATTDPLTGLLNRRQGLRILENEIARARRGLQHLGVVMVDLDHFKKLNDTLGHQAGDAVLVEAAKRLRAASRQYDAVVRWGGEEILILCPGANMSATARVAERLHAELRNRPFVVGGAEPLRITASFGACATDGLEHPDLEMLIAACDQALYDAKAQGRDRVQLAIACSSGPSAPSVPSEPLTRISRLCLADVEGLNLSSQ